MEARLLANRAAQIIVDKLGEDVVILDLREQSPISDYFVLATASSSVHCQALGEEVELRLKRQGQRVHHVEGTGQGQWILLDYFDVVVHIFLGEVRQFYGLERLWGDVPRQVVSHEK